MGKRRKTGVIVLTSKEIEYQKEAMRKYIQKLEGHTTKIVKTPPQTELEKPLNNRGSKRKHEKNRNAAIGAPKARVMKEKKKMIQEQCKQMGMYEMQHKKKDSKTCIQCGLNPAWLDYPICYQCYTKKEKEQNERTHYMGGYNPL